MFKFIKAYKFEKNKSAQKNQNTACIKYRAVLFHPRQIWRGELEMSKLQGTNLPDGQTDSQE